MNTPLCIDLNADLGEGCPWDHELLKRVTSASICCGAHAGTPEGICQTLRAAHQEKVLVGAHPGYPDREYFGRREQVIDRQAAYALIIEQVNVLKGWATPLNVEIRFLKPHGTFYNQAQVDPEIAAGIVEAARSLNLPILGMPGSCVEGEAYKQDVRFIAEGFADRRYTPEGRLVPRSQPGAVLEDPGQIARQVVSLITRGINTLCIHGDSPNAIHLADVVRAAAMSVNARIVSFLN